MRTNIEIDDGLMSQAMKAGPYKTKKDAVEAGLRLLARQAAYREVLKWRGKLHWEGEESIDWAAPVQEKVPMAAEPPAPRYQAPSTPQDVVAKAASKAMQKAAPKTTPKTVRRAGR